MKYSCSVVLTVGSHTTIPGNPIQTSVNTKLSAVFHIQVSVVCYEVTAGVVQGQYGTVRCEPDHEVSGYK
jgi:hypothetical protein